MIKIICPTKCGLSIEVRYISHNVLSYTGYVFILRLMTHKRSNREVRQKIKTKTVHSCGDLNLHLHSIIQNPLEIFSSYNKDITEELC